MRGSLAFAAFVLFASTVLGLQPGTQIFVPAAARGTGSDGSFWVTSLFFTNPGPDTATVTVAWLVRDQANPQPATAVITIEPATTRVYDDAIVDLLGLEGGSGAFRLTSDTPIVVSSAILNTAGGTELGQGFEGVPAAAALRPGHESWILGARHGTDYRANVYLIDASGAGSRATMTLLDPEGHELGSKTYELGAHMPVLEQATGLGFAAVDNGTIRVEVTEGAVIAGASRVYRASGDPLTLWASTEPGGAGVAVCAPLTITGLRVRTTMPSDGEDDEVFEVTITSETTATITDGPYEIEASFVYVPFGTGAIFTAEIPQWNLSGIRATALCETETSGVFVAVGDTPFGPMTVKGTAELLQ